MRPPDPSGAPDADPVLRQVLKGLALNRIPGWNFPGNFLEVSFDELGDEGARLSIEAGAHNRDAQGQVGLAALWVLADIAMAAGMRHRVGPRERMATVHMNLQLTGASRAGDLHASGRFDGYVAGAAARQGLSRGEIRCGGELVATGSATFVALGFDGLAAPLPMRPRDSFAAVPPLAVPDLNDAEQGAYERAKGALGPGHRHSFLDRFWGLMPVGAEGNATCDFPNGLHVGNRVGHTQGGLTFALAATTGEAALDDGWCMVGVSAWYLAPGTGPWLRASSEVVHRGTRTAVVRTHVVDSENRAILEAFTHHARRA